MRSAPLTEVNDIPILSSSTPSTGTPKSYSQTSPLPAAGFSRSRMDFTGRENETAAQASISFHSSCRMCANASDGVESLTAPSKTRRPKLCLSEASSDSNSHIPQSASTRRQALASFGNEKRYAAEWPRAETSHLIPFVSETE